MDRQNEIPRTNSVVILQLLWRRKFVIAAALCLAVVLGLVIIAKSERVYSVTMIVGPAEQSAMPGQSDVLRQMVEFSGLGIQPDRSSSMASYTVMMSGGTLVAEQMEQRYHVLKDLLPEEWNDTEQRWKRPEEMSLGIRGWVKRKLGLPGFVQPSVTALAELLKKTLIFEDIQRSPFLEVTYRTKHPADGVRLLDQLNRVTNDVYARDRVATDEQEVAYIDSVLRTETRVDIRRAQADLLEKYETELIMIHSGQPLLAQVIQPPVSSDQPYSPKPGLILVAAPLVGLLVGVVISLLWPVRLSGAAAVVPVLSHGRAGLSSATDSRVQSGQSVR